MRAIEVLRAPWAILPETLTSMFDVYERHAAGFALDLDNLKAVKAAAGKPLNNDSLPYQVVDGVAVINCVGVMGKRFDLFTQICGGVSTQRLQDELATALNDPNVHSILLNVDSPGGEVDGVQSLAADVYAARASKPIVSLIDGMCASGAYWVASAADQVYVNEGTAVVGSIGVVLGHTDVSRAQEMRGVKTTEITAGKFKRIASSFAPLSNDGRQSLQDIVDAIYSVFVEDVARNRGVSVDTVLADMADGRLFIGKQAVSAGLADGITTLSALIAQLNADRTAAVTRVGAHAPNSQIEVEAMKVMICGVECESQDAINAAVTAALAKATADATEAATLKAAAIAAESKAEGVTAGAKAERERITAVTAAALPGHEKLTADAIANGTPAAEFALALIGAEKAKRGEQATAQHEDAPKPIKDAGAAASGASTPAEPNPSVVAEKAREYMTAHKGASLTDAVNKVRAEMGLK